MIFIETKQNTLAQNAHLSDQPSHSAAGLNSANYQNRMDKVPVLNEHIMAIRPYIPYLRELKEQGLTVDVFCGYRTNRDTAGFEIDHRCLGLFTELQVPLGVSVIVA